MLERAFLPITTPSKPNFATQLELASAILENEFIPNPNTCHGEMWVDSYLISGSSSLILSDGSKVPMWKVISEDPEWYLDVDACKKSKGTFRGNEYGGEPLKHLPVLFKVLSFDRTLPLQAHPDRVLMVKLLRRKEQSGVLRGEGGSPVDGGSYKPEVVVVCIPEKFVDFIGFRPLLEIQQFLRKVPELIGHEEVVKGVLGLKLSNSLLLDFEDEKKLLKRLFSGIIQRSGEVIAEQCKKLATRLDEYGDTVVFGDKYTVLGKVISQCLKDYLDDKGIFMARFLISLKYEGAVVRVHGIHAYGEGDTIECMAWSNNILTYGFQFPEGRFSPEAFISSTAFHTHPNPDLLPTPPSPMPLSEPWGRAKVGKTTPRPVPLEEFKLIHIVLNHQGDFEETTPFPRPINGPLVFIVVRGKAEIQLRDGKESMVMERGRVVFVRPDVVWRITALAKDGADIWGAYEEEPAQTADHVVLPRSYLSITIKY